jgi:hypothetical protein
MGSTGATYSASRKAPGSGSHKGWCEADNLKIIKQPSPFKPPSQQALEPLLNICPAHRAIQLTHHHQGHTLLVQIQTGVTGTTKGKHFLYNQFAHWPVYSIDYTNVSPLFVYMLRIQS